MKIALIVPEFLSGSSFLQPPLDMLYCSSLLEQEGHDTEIIDCRAKPMPLALLGNMLQSSDALIISTTPYDQVQNYFVDYRLEYAIKTINYLKDLRPDRKVIVCGSHGTVRPDIVLRDTRADIIVRGEYEFTVLAVVAMLERCGNISSIPNIAYLEDKRTICTDENPDLYHPVNFGEVFPHYSKIDFGAYYGDTYVNNKPTKCRKWGIIQASRGCPFDCAFCFNFWGRKVRKRNPSSIVAEMEILEKKYGVEQVFFIDFTFTLDHEWVSAICGGIRQKNLRLKWAVETRCDLVNRAILSEMKSANCERIWLGVESFNDQVISMTGKYNNAESAFRAIELVNHAGIEPSVFLMLGLPGETISSLNETIQSLYNLKVSYTKSIIISTPRFGTPFYEMAKQQYPHLGDRFEDLDAVKGLVGNQMHPHVVKDAVALLRNRGFLFNSTCPRIS